MVRHIVAWILGRSYQKKNVDYMVRKSRGVGEPKKSD